MTEYLRCYEFPQPPEVRYGFVRMESPQAKDRVSLFGQAWVPLHAAGTVLLVHGYSEHSGNYAQLVRELVAARFAVAALDLRGHGLSEGSRGHAEFASVYAEDLEAFAHAVFPLLLPNRPLYLWGHSLGALACLQAISRGKLPLPPAAAVLTSPLLGFPELSGVRRLMAGLAPMMASLFPTLPVAHGIPPEILSHDEEYLARRHEDPLIARVATPRWLTSMREAVASVQAEAKSFQTLSPTLLLLAGDEKVTNLNEARRFAFNAYAGMRHKVIEFPGYYHELEKERVIRERIVSESIAWFRSHSQS